MAQHPTEETINITRKFLGGELDIPGQAPRGDQNFQAPQSRLPRQAAPIAGQRAFGRQGIKRRPGDGGGLIRSTSPITQPPAIRSTSPVVQPSLIRSTSPVSQPSLGSSLSNRFFDLPGPVDFSRTSQGQDLMRRILANRVGFR
jgi:hypothetical protein